MYFIYYYISITNIIIPNLKYYIYCIIIHRMYIMIYMNNIIIIIYIYSNINYIYIYIYIIE